MRWSWDKILLFTGIAAGGGTLAFISAGTATPVVSALLGSAAGFAGLAALKGGALAAGCAGGATGAGGTVAGGAMLGGAMGLSGVAAASAGLAAHGGGMAVGSASMAGGANAVTVSAGSLGHTGVTVSTVSLPTEANEVQILQTIASKLSKEIFSLNKRLNSAKDKDQRNLPGIRQELAAKETQLKMIGNALK